MIYVLPLIASVCSAIDLTLSKYFYRKWHMLTSREFNWLSFVALCTLLLLLAPVFHLWPGWNTITAHWQWLLPLVLVASIHNVLWGWGMEHERISAVQPFLLFNPIVGMLITGLFYTDERRWVVYVAAVIASALLVWSHVKRHHLKISRGLFAIFGFMLLYALELVILKQLVDVFPPLSLYLIRGLGIVIMLTLFRFPNLRLIKAHHLVYFAGLSFIWATSAWATYSAFRLLGVTVTMLFTLLAPILGYWLSIIFLKERWDIKNIITSAAIALLVVAVNL